jgi:hypothetical protein
MKPRNYTCWVLSSTDIHRVASEHGHHLSRIEERLVASRFSEAMGLDLDHWEDLLAESIAREKGCDIEDDV